MSSPGRAERRRPARSSHRRALPTRRRGALGRSDPCRVRHRWLSASHPVAVPQLQVTIDYPPVDPEGLSLASGSILSGHADFWNVWDQDKLEGEVADCLNRDLVCGVSG